MNVAWPEISSVSDCTNLYSPQNKWGYIARNFDYWKIRVGFGIDNKLKELWAFVTQNIRRFVVSFIKYLAYKIIF